MSQINREINQTHSLSNTPNYSPTPSRRHFGRLEPLLISQIVALHRPNSFGRLTTHHQQYLGHTDRLPRYRARRLERALGFALQQVKLERLNQIVFAQQISLQAWLVLDARHQIVLGQQWQSHVLHQLGKELLSHGRIEHDPRDDAFVHLFLGGHRQAIALDEIQHLRVRQIEELVELDDLSG